MSPQAVNNWKGIAAGVGVGLLIMVGGKMMDAVLKTDVIDEIKQDIKELHQDVKEMRKDYVLKEDYDRDKKTMIELVRRK